MSLKTLKRGFKDLIKRLRKDSRNAYQSAWYGASDNTNTPGILTTSPNNFVSINGLTQSPMVDEREVKKPVEVVDSIMIDQPEMDLANLDEKIKVVKRRIKVLNEQSVNLGDEREALNYLQNRKLYIKNQNLFRWKVTTDAKIQELLGRYKLMLVPFQSYSKNVPNEALDEIEAFTKAFEEIIDEGHPCLSLICDQGGPEHKKDPILLAKSPFGKWYYVLGAWDKEVEYVDDLIYNGK